MSWATWKTVTGELVAGLAAVYEAVDTLAKAPRPVNSTAYGPDARRLRVGRYRVLLSD
ncbi:hypothetical protein WBG99_21320 [Streptomyces sp. TG1A-60]|uniref:type II toxin-antitoxin system RelE family toxin n=1 Tax=Streptomyces sp. TG1A-60 TaxID=3129111 RepID=UPI0030CF81EB